MRFEQLKRQSNTVIRKKLYKSGKNWIVATTLAFASGLFFVGINQEITVKAENNTTLTNSSMTTAVDSGTPINNIESKSISNADSDDTTGKSSDANIVNADNGDESRSKSETSNNTYDKVNQDTSKQQTPITPYVSNNVGGIDDPNNFATSKDYGNIGVNTDTGNVGSSWYINNDGVLHISQGTWGAQRFTWNDVKEKSKIKSIHFDGPVIANSSISELFYGLNNLTDVGNMKGNFDTSNTGSFSALFTNTGLTSYDFSTLDIHNAYDLSSMFAGTHLTTVDMSDIKLPKIRNLDDMFRDTEELKSANLSNLDFNDAELHDMFEGSGIESVNLSGINTSKASDVTGMFSGAQNLVNLDLTDLTMNDRSRDYAWDLLLFARYADTSKVKIKSLTLNPTLNLSDSGLVYNTSLYDGWISNADPSASPISSEELMSLYNGTTSPVGIQTWTLANKKSVNYQINYFRSDQNQTTDKPFAVKTNLSGIDGSTITIPVLPGYTNPTPSSEKLDFSQGANQVFNVVSDVVKPYNLDIALNYDDDSRNDTTKHVILPGYPGNIADDSTFQSGLNELPNDNQTLDTAKTTFNLSAFGGPSTPSHLSDFAVDMGLSTTETNLKTIINTLMNYLNKHGFLSNGGNGSNIDFVDAYYGTYKAPIVTPSNNSGHGNSSTSQPEHEVDVINQTSATYSDQPKVQLYDSDGNSIDDAFLNPDTSWYNDKKMILNDTTYYRVATDKWVKSSDVYVYIDNITYIGVYKDNYGHLVNAHGQIISRELKQATDWFSDRIADINGAKYYRVATDEFVRANDVYEYTKDVTTISTNQLTSVYDEKGKVTTINLPANSSYKVDRFEIINGERYYRVATNEFVKANDVNL
jgi:KxYKxGKxW signal peptide